jgi:hypothetical protein
MSTLAATNLKNASSGSNNIVLNTDGTTTITSPSNIIKSGTAVASTSGTAIDFTSIPSWVKRITVMFNGVSTNGSSNLLIQIGAGSITTSGYTSGAWTANTSNTTATNGYLLTGANVAATIYHGNLFICNAGSNLWIESHAIGGQSGGYNSVGGGGVTLSGTLDRIRITTAGGTDTFDAGTINILYEG